AGAGPGQPGRPAGYPGQPGRPAAYPGQPGRPAATPARRTSAPASTAPARTAPASTGPASTAVAPVPPPSAPRRVTVVAGGRRADIALPAPCTIAELTPVLLHAVAPHLADEEAGTRGWVLRRVAGPPLAGAQTVAASDLRDGEILHLVPAGLDAPVAVFDDTVDAVADNVRTGPGRWGPRLSGRVGLAVAVLSFVLAAVTMAAAVAGPAGPAAAATMAVALLSAGVVVERRRGLPDLAVALTAAGVPAAAAAAAAAGAGRLPTAADPALCTAALAVTALYAAVAALLLRLRRAWFVAGTGVCASGAVAAACVTVGVAGPASAAAVLVVLAVVLTPAFPGLALRMGGLPVPEVPADMATFRDAEQPTPATETAGRTRAAETALTALLAGSAATVVAGGAVLLDSGVTAGLALTAAAALALLVRSRAYAAAAHHAVLLAAGMGMLVAVSAKVVLVYGGPAAAAIGAATLAAGIGCAVHAARAGRRSPSPRWARLADVADFVMVTSLVPLGVWVLGLYGSAQALAG
ncbi:type VII secretion integral membrane protein EccD, partial [Mangrovihabitans endophyticus]|uniref:type VII secretion integral membrane protein EccD n=1 Tax=Mangrovihabitans endophyticus TaxID=1751298 RepID=UPI001E573CE4